MDQFHFLRWPWLLGVLPVLGVYRLWRRRGPAAGDWRAVCDPELLPHVLIGAVTGSARRWLGPRCWLAGAFLALLALAGPSWEKLPTPAVRNQQALVLVLDLSPAMAAVDLSPNRMERARFKLTDIIRQRQDGLTALVVFGGDAYPVTPLTDDGETILSQLAALGPGILPERGSRPAAGLEAAQRILQQAGLVQGDILLISGGGEEGDAAAAAAAARRQGFRVSVLGSGTAAGGPVALARGGFLQDAQGKLVLARLDGEQLREIAARGGGLYRPLTADGSDLAVLLPLFAGSVAAADGDSAITLEQWADAGIWLVLPLLPLAALAFRRGLLLAALLLVLAPRPAPAWSWRDLWQTRDQQARLAFDAGDFGRAADTFDDPAWKAAAQYRAGQAEAAAQTLAGRHAAEDEYNRGNALARSKQYPEAIAAYQQALSRDPGHEDALYNKKLVEDVLKRQQQEASSQQQSAKDQQEAGQQGQRSEAGQGQKDQHGQKRQAGEQGDGKEQSGDPQANEEAARAGRPAGDAGQTADEPATSEERAAEETAEHEKDGPRKGEPETSATAPQQAAAEAAPQALNEDQQASEQWLRRIPDDPGGLLKRKFLYQYRQRQGRRPPP